MTHAQDTSFPTNCCKPAETDAQKCTRSCRTASRPFPEVAKNARVLWFSRGSKCETTDFWLAGVVLGLVVYNNLPGLDVHFPSVVFKKIKEEELGLEDMRQVFPETYLSLRSLLLWKPDPGLTKEEASEAQSSQCPWKIAQRA